MSLSPSPAELMSDSLRRAFEAHVLDGSSSGFESFVPTYEANSPPLSSRSTRLASSTRSRRKTSLQPARSFRTRTLKNSSTLSSSDREVL